MLPSRVDAAVEVATGSSHHGRCPAGQVGGEPIHHSARRATEVVFPQLDIKKELPKNTPVTITVPTDKEQKLTFQCGMGMYKSSVVVSGS